MSRLDVTIYRSSVPEKPFLVVGMERDRVLFAYAVETLTDAEQHRRDELEHLLYRAGVAVQQHVS